MANLKDILTTVIGLVQLVGNIVIQAINTANGGTINWLSVGISVLIAVVLYFQGKNPNGSTKSDSQVAEQNAQSK
jgi:hypothetical protein